MLSAMVSLLKAAGLLRDPSAIGVTSPVACRQIEAAMLKLGKQLRSASSLPLKIVAVQAAQRGGAPHCGVPSAAAPFCGRGSALTHRPKWTAAWTPSTCWRSWRAQVWLPCLQALLHAASDWASIQDVQSLSCLAVLTHI